MYSHIIHRKVRFHILNFYFLFLKLKKCCATAIKFRRIRLFQPFYVFIFKNRQNITQLQKRKTNIWFFFFFYYRMVHFRFLISQKHFKRMMYNACCERIPTPSPWIFTVRQPDCGRHYPIKVSQNRAKFV